MQTQKKEFQHYFKPLGTELYLGGVEPPKRLEKIDCLEFKSIKELEKKLKKLHNQFKYNIEIRDLLYRFNNYHGKITSCTNFLNPNQDTYRRHWKNYDPYYHYQNSNFNVEDLVNELNLICEKRKIDNTFTFQKNENVDRNIQNIIDEANEQINILEDIIEQVNYRIKQKQAQIKPIVNSSFVFQTLQDIPINGEEANLSYNYISNNENKNIDNTYTGEAMKKSIKKVKTIQNADVKPIPGDKLQEMYKMV